MDEVGGIALVGALVSGIIVLARPSTRHAALAAVACWWVALLWLAHRFLTVDLDLAVVAGYSRQELPLPERLAGVWAGPAGSLLLWFAVAVPVLTIATAVPSGGPTAGAERRARRVVGATSAAGAAVLLASVRPFELLAEAPVRGDGLAPVLEHPAMFVHPPLLYVAQAAVLAAAIAPRHQHRWAAAAGALLTSATLLGAWWAHDELGWGGWWAWDPVENTALAPLLAVVAALHARGATAARRWSGVAAVAVLTGIAVTRSGLPASVHAFASGGPAAVGFGAAAVIAAVAVARIRRPDEPPSPAGSSTAPDGADRAPAVVLGAVAAWVLLVVCAAGAAAMWLGVQDPPGNIDGALLARLLAPAGLVVAGGVLVLGLRRGRSMPSWCAHVGVLVFLVGALASSADRSVTAGVDRGEALVVDGATVVVTGSEVTERRGDLERLVVAVEVDGSVLHPALERYPDLERTRARPDRRTDWWGETEVVVGRADGDRFRVTLRRHPGLPWVWTGGVLAVVGLAAVALRRPRGTGEPPGPQDRRRRLAASSESSVPAPESGASAPEEPVTSPAEPAG